MAAKDRHEEKLAARVREAEHKVRRAHASRGPDRIAKIAAAEHEHLKHSQHLDHHLSGQAGPPINPGRGPNNQDSEPSYDVPDDPENYVD